ncbi:hypothetical protein [Enterobacter sp. CC120223-11]|nr:hypothetical protein [Enterobacter sp. CC120223-11]SNY63941.1 hypothetical protein SAMN02744775_01091 [Enterobacter sp. CC120223-11]
MTTDEGRKRGFTYEADINNDDRTTALTSA